MRHSVVQIYSESQMTGLAALDIIASSEMGHFLDLFPALISRTFSTECYQAWILSNHSV